MKDLSKMLVVKELITSLYLLKKKIFWLVIASLVDAVFFLAWGFFTTPVKDKIVQHSILIGNQLSAMMANEQARTGILKHLFTPEVWPLTRTLLLLIFLLFIISYIIYVIFHGTSWWMATRIAEQKWKYKTYLLGFAKINLVWLAGYVIYKFFDVILGLRSLIVQKISPGAPNIAGKILLVYLILLALAAFFSYPRLKIKELFKTPWKISVPLIILSASMYLTTQFILNSIGKLNVDAALVAGIILLFPVMNLIRTYSIRVLNNVHSHT